MLYSIDSPVNYNVIVSMEGGKMLFKIGDFSKLTGLPVKTLRYYDDIDLFKPIDVDLFTGYRYYSKEQIKDLELINKLKNIGFTLEEIKNSWDNFNEELFLEKKKKILNEIELKNNSIKELDILRSKIDNGKIVDEVKTTIRKKSII